MSEHGFGDGGHCPECGGSDGLHFSDCIYDGTDGERGYFPIQAEVPMGQAEKYGSFISSLSLLDMELMSYWELSY